MTAVVSASPDRRLFAFEHAGVVPDVLVLSKALRGGRPPGRPVTARSAKEEGRKSERRPPGGSAVRRAPGPWAGPAPEELLGDGTAEGRAARRSVLEAAVACLDRVATGRHGPYSGASPRDLEELVAGVDPLPLEGLGARAALDGLAALALRHAVDPANPAAAAHLHCAPLHVALAGELLAAAANQSLDSWDQAPIATHLERRLVRAVAALAGYDPAVADGVLTSGGTQSNLQGLLLARERAGRRLGRDLAAEGLGLGAGRWRILCSRAAHFSVQRSAALLGLGHRAVVPVAVDADGRMRPEALDRALDGLAADGLMPITLVASAGTTDFGAIDPLPELVERARQHGLWLHVDAAVGGALLFSRRHAGRLDGLAAADSIAIDFHKLLWQPLACGLFLVRDRAELEPLEVEVAYLNADDPEPPRGWRMPHLVSRSLATSRRADRGHSGPGAGAPAAPQHGGLPLRTGAGPGRALRPAQRRHPHPAPVRGRRRGRPHPPRRPRAPEAHPAQSARHRRRPGQPGRARRPDRRRPRRGPPVTTTAEAAGTVAAAPSPPANEPLARAGDAAVTTLLNCFLRETGADVGGDGRLRLRRLGLELLAPLAHRSATGHHTWRRPGRPRPGPRRRWRDWRRPGHPGPRQPARPRRTRRSSWRSSRWRSGIRCTRRPRAASGWTPGSCAHGLRSWGRPFRCTGSGRTGRSWRRTRRWRARPPPGCWRACSASRMTMARRCCPPTRGRRAGCWSGRGSGRCWRPACWTTSGRSARPGSRPPRCARCTGRARRSCSSSRSACASPTRCAPTSPRSWRAESRSSGCWMPAWLPSWQRASPASRSCRTPPGPPCATAAGENPASRWCCAPIPTRPPRRRTRPWWPHSARRRRAAAPRGSRASSTAWPAGPASPWTRPRAAGSAAP